MADARGGYRKPSNPAPASAPGALSKRTDGGPSAPKQPIRALPDAAYGEQATFRADQQGAPMSATAKPQAGQAGPLADLSQVVPFGAPSQRPDEPVTAGAPSGPGPGPEALGIGNQGNDPGLQYVRQLLPMFELAAQLPTSSVEFRQFVRRLRAGAI